MWPQESSSTPRAGPTSIYRLPSPGQGGHGSIISSPPPSIHTLDLQSRNQGNIKKAFRACVTIVLQASW